MNFIQSCIFKSAMKLARILKDVVTVGLHRVRLGLPGAGGGGGGGCEGRHWPPGHHGENSGGPPAGHRLCRQDQGNG